MLCQFLLYSKVIQLYIYIYSFPLWLIIGYWIEFPLLYSRTLSFIHSIYKSLPLIIPNSNSIPPSPIYPLATTSLFPMSVILFLFHAAAAKSLQSCPTLCDPIDGSPLGSPIPGILQARTLAWVAISYSNEWKWKVKVQSLSSDPMDCSPPGSSVRGIFQAKVLEWVAIAFSNIYPTMYKIDN